MVGDPTARLGRAVVGNEAVTDRLAAWISQRAIDDNLRELTDGIGGRLTGSPAYVH
jgi:hypothetical protein